MVSPERLHFNVKEGWEPLCKILDCHVPDELFPHMNDRLQMQNAIKEIISKAIMRWVGLFGVLSVAVAIGFYRR